MIHKFTQGDLFFVLDVNSGAVHIIDEVVYRALDFYPNQSTVDVIRMLKGEYPETEIKEALSEIDHLIDSEMLFTDDAYINAIEFTQRAPVIKAMCLHVAHDCNIRCAYCFASQGDFKGDRGLMPFEVGKKALDLLVEKSGSRRNLEVDFFGGEPLMNLSVVKDLVEYGRSIEAANNKHFRFTITTNGVLLNDDSIDYINRTMDNVVLSLDGRPAVNDKMRYTITGGGTYDMIVPKFKELVDRRGDKSYYVRGTFTRNNLDFTQDVMHMADLGFSSTSIEPVVAKPEDSYALLDEDVDYIKMQYEALAEQMLEREAAGKPFKLFSLRN